MGRALRSPGMCYSCPCLGSLCPSVPIGETKVARGPSGDGSWGRANAPVLCVSHRRTWSSILRLFAGFCVVPN